MKSPNSEITETGRRKGSNKNNEGLRVKIVFCFLFLKMKNILNFFSYCVKKTAKKVKNKIKYNHEII